MNIKVIFVLVFVCMSLRYAEKKFYEAFYDRRLLKSKIQVRNPFQNLFKLFGNKLLFDFWAAVVLYRIGTIFSQESGL